MRPGDAVIYLADPLLYGQGVFHHVTRDGLIVVEFADGTREAFHPQELDTPDRAPTPSP